MTGKYVAAIDAGTGNGKCLVFNSEGTQIAFGAREWSHPEIPEFPGSRVFNTENNWRLICEATRETLQKAKIRPEEICGIRATSMREGMVLYDFDGREIWACPNADARAGKEAIQLIKRSLAMKIYSRAGDWLAMPSPPRFIWVRKHQPQIYRRIAHMTMLADWVLYKLSGKFGTDPSVGSSSNLFQLSRRTWSEKVLDWCGLRREIFPEVYESGTVIGEVTGMVSGETGFREHTPVVMGCRRIDFREKIEHRTHRTL